MRFANMFGEMGRLHDTVSRVYRGPTLQARTRRRGDAWFSGHRVQLRGAGLQASQLGTVSVRIERSTRDAPATRRP